MSFLFIRYIRVWLKCSQCFDVTKNLSFCCRPMPVNFTYLAPSGCYIQSNGDWTHEEAEDICESLDTRLLSLETTQETQAVTQWYSTGKPIVVIKAILYFKPYEQMINLWHVQSRHLALWSLSGKWHPGGLELRDRALIHIKTPSYQ